MNTKNREISITDSVLIALRQIIRCIDLHSKHLIKHFGLTGPQLVVLQELSRSDEITASQLARASSISQATVTGILERLEKRALISRRRSTSDRRRVLVKTAPAGEEILDAAPPLMQASFISQFNRLQDWEQYMILSSLQRLVSIMDAKAIKAGPFLATGPLGESADRETLVPRTP